MDFVMLGLRYLHILGAIMLMGATIFARFAVLPSMKTLSQADQELLHTEIRRRWSKFVMAATLMLLVSGIANLGIYGARYQFPTFPLYNAVAGLKFLLALPIFFFAALLTGRSNLAKRIQTKAKFWLTVNLALALIMVLLGGGLRFVQREVKGAKKAAAKVAEVTTQQSNVVGLAQSLIRQDQAVKEKLGDELKFGEVHDAKSAFEFQVTGSKASGLAHLEISAKEADWKITQLAITCDDKTTLNIDPAALSNKPSNDPTNINLPDLDTSTEDMPKK